MTRSRPHRRAATCNSCGAEVIFALTENGAYQPLDPKPNDDGNVLAYKDATTTWRVRSLASVGEDAPRHPLERTYMPHAATCRGDRQLRLVGDNVTPIRRRR